VFQQSPYDDEYFYDVSVMMPQPLTTVLRVGEDCVGVASILPLTYSLDKYHSMTQVTRFFTRNVAPDVASNLEEALRANDAALLLSERVHNAPPPLAAPLLSVVLEDVRLGQNSTEADPDLEPYRPISRLLVCAKAYLEGEGEVLASAGAVPVAPQSKTGARSKSKVQQQPCVCVMSCGNACTMQLRRSSTLQIAVRRRQSGCSCCLPHSSGHCTVACDTAAAAGCSVAWYLPDRSASV
jgi:BCCIP